MTRGAESISRCVWPIYGFTKYFQREYVATFLDWSAAVLFVTDTKERELYIGAPLYDQRRREPPYGPMCQDPKLCAGKGYCPRDPTCGD